MSLFFRWKNTNELAEARAVIEDAIFPAMHVRIQLLLCYVESDAPLDLIINALQRRALEHDQSGGSLCLEFLERGYREHTVAHPES